MHSADKCLLGLIVAGKDPVNIHIGPCIVARGRFTGLAQGREGRESEVQGASFEEVKPRGQRCLGMTGGEPGEFVFHLEKKQINDLVEILFPDLFTEFGYALPINHSLPLAVVLVREARGKTLIKD